MANVIKIGLGRSKSGKILDSETRFYAYDRYGSLKNALSFWLRNKNKEAFVSINGKAYKKITMEMLIDKIEHYTPWRKSFNSRLGKITVEEKIEKRITNSYKIYLDGEYIGEMNNIFYPMSETFKNVIIQFIFKSLK